jgi:hypothetical protein
MKTNILKLVCLMLISFLTTNASFTQSSLTDFTFFENSDVFSSAIQVDDLKNDVDLYTLDDKTITVDYIEDAEQLTVEEVLVLYMLGIGAGIGFGEGDTFYCLHAKFLYRLAMFTTAALYGGIGLGYSGFSGDFFTQSMLAVTGYMLMFSALTKYREVFLIWGLLASYAFGNETLESSNIKYDLTRFAISAMIGFSIVLTQRLMLALYSPILTYQTQTRENNGNESKDNSTFFFLNKNNAFTISLIFNLALASRGTASE